MEIKCPKCGSKFTSRDRRPGGDYHCFDCAHTWNSAADSIIDEALEQPLSFKIAALSLGPDDTLVVKAKGEALNDEQMLEDLTRAIKERFPKNKIMLFFLPGDSDIDLSVIKSKINE